MKKHILLFILMGATSSSLIYSGNGCVCKDGFIAGDTACTECKECNEHGGLKKYTTTQGCMCNNGSILGAGKICSKCETACQGHNGVDYYN